MEIIMKAYGNQIKKKVLGDTFKIIIMNSMKDAGKITRKRVFLELNLLMET
jgi:hypothetical protein